MLQVEQYARTQQVDCAKNLRKAKYIALLSIQRSYTAIRPLLIFHKVFQRAHTTHRTRLIKMSCVE